MSLRSIGARWPSVPKMVVALPLGLGLAGGLPLSVAGAVPAAGAAARAAAGGGRGAPVTLVSQSPWVTPGTPFTAEVALGRAAVPASQLEVRVTLYNRLVARSTFDSTLAGTPAGGVLDTAGPFPVTSPRGTAAVSVAVGNSAAPPPPGDLDLSCEPGSCSGVYPIELTVERAGSGRTVGRILTYLTYDEADLTDPAQAAGPDALRFGWVLPVEVPAVLHRRARSTDGVLGRAPGATMAALEAVVADLARTTVPVTLELTGRTVQALATGGGRAGRTAVGQLAGLAAQPAVQVPTPPYVPIDPGALAGGGVGTEVQTQLARGRALLGTLGIASTGGTWIADGPVGTNLAAGLDLVAGGQGVPAGAMRVVVPDADLAPTDDPDTSSQPFELEVGGHQVVAAAGDGGLAAHFDAEPGDPVLEANQMLADLALIHFEHPSLSSPRGVIALPRAGWVPDPRFVDTLVHGLTGNPVVEPVTLATFFADVPVGVNGSSPTRRPLQGGTGPVTGRAVAAAIGRARLRLSGFDSAVRGVPALTTALDDALLASESSTLGPAGQAAGVATTEHALSGQLAEIQLATGRTVTLTALSGAIPVTVVSSAPYTVYAVLTLSSPKFVFASGPTHMVIDHATNPERIAATARTSGDLPVDVTLTSPRDGLVITRGELVVRSTATSVVGIVLTVAAAAVLAAWWARTWRARPGPPARRRAVSELLGGSPDPATPPGSDAVQPMSLRRATVWMAVGTGLSRVTGVARVVALVYALGFTRLADAYNLANTAPNMLYDIVLGGVLSATFIPVFVDRLSTRSDAEAWQAISAVVSVSVAVLLGATVVFWVAAPVVIAGLTALGHPHTAGGLAALALERRTATTLLRWFVPQVALYGCISLATALLNVRGRFVAPMWAPIANNLVCIGVLVEFTALTRRPSLLGVEVHGSWMVLLGLGTTIGVAVQAALLVPVLRRSRLTRLRWRWQPGHEAVRTVVRLGGWTIGFVVANQVALYVVLALAVGAGGAGPVSSWTYAYAFMQMPYAVVAVSVMSAVTPDLARRWSTGDLAAFRRRMAGGLRAVLAIIIPAAVGVLLLAHPAVDLLPTRGVTGTGSTGAALAMFALGLPGFCTFLYVVRVLQAMQRTRVAFWLYLVENGLNIALAVALVGPLGVRGLALSLSVAYSVAAACGLVVLKRWLGRLGPRRAWQPLRRVLVASAVMGVVVLVVSNLSGAAHGFGLAGRVGVSVAVGVAVYVATMAALARLGVPRT